MAFESFVTEDPGDSEWKRPPRFESFAEPVEPPTRSGKQFTGDMLIKAAQGVVGLGESAVGLGNIVTGGAVGKAMDAIGYDPVRTRETLGEFSSDKQKQLEREIGGAGKDLGLVDGFVAQLSAIARNPSFIPGAVVESLPSMLAAGGGAKALAERIYARAAATGGEAAGAAALEKASGALKWAAAGGEGVLSSGQIAEDARQAGRDWSQYVLPALAGGAGTAVIGRAAGAIPGLGDAETALFARGAGAATGNRAVRTIKGAFQEGLLEEMPQSAQEQVFGNVAQGKPAGQGVGSAAAQGLVTGAAMGAGAGMGSRATPSVPTVESPSEQVAGALPSPVAPGMSGESIETQTARQAAADAAQANADRVYSERDAYERDQAALAEVRKRTNPLARIINATNVDEAIATASAAVTDTSVTDLVVGQAQASATRRAGMEALQKWQQEQDAFAEQERLNIENAAARSTSDTPMAAAMRRAAGVPDEPAQAEAIPENPLADVEQPRPASPIAPKTVAGAAVAEHTDEQLRLLAEDATVPAITRHAAAAALQARTDVQTSMDAQPAAVGVESRNAANATTGENPANLPAVEPTAVRVPEAVSGPDTAARPGSDRVDVVLPARNGADANAVPADGQPASRELPSPPSADLILGKPATGYTDKNLRAFLKSGSARVKAVAQAELARRAGPEWAAFAPESGTIGVPRADMPQIKAEHRGAMVNFLNARGVTHEQQEVAAGTLKPTQAEYSPSKVRKAQEFDGGDRSILISSDNHVVDGHHQWLAKMANGEPIPVIRLNAPIRELLPLVREFPSAENARGATVPVKQNGQNVSHGTLPVPATAVAQVPVAPAPPQRERIKREAEAGAFQLQAQVKPAAVADAEGKAATRDIFAQPANTLSPADLLRAAAARMDAQDTTPKRPRFGSGAVETLSEAETELRALGHKKEKPGDVQLGNLEFAPFDAVVKLAKEGIASGAIKPSPAQIVFTLDIGFRDVDRVLAAATGKEDGDAPLLSRRTLTGADDELTTAWTMLAENDELFQLPTSNANTIEGVAHDIDKDISVREIESPTDQPKVTHTWSVRIGEHTGVITENSDGEVWANLSDFTAGKGGRTAYQIVATYAHNAGKVFIGDPWGLSDLGVFRRTENMLASALRHGTTRHLDPHERQVKPDDAVKGRARPLNWKPGDDVHNLRELILTSHDNTIRALPEAADLEYDFEHGNILDTATGKPFGKAALRTLANQSAGARAAGVGEKTLTRTAYTTAVLRRDGPDGWRRILERISRLADQHLTGNALKGASYSRQPEARESGLSASGLQTAAAVSQALGAEIGKSDRVQVVQSIGGLPDGLRSYILKSQASDAQGVFDPDTGKVYLVADNIVPGRELAVLLHESSHMGLQKLIGDQPFRRLANQIRAWAAFGKNTEHGKLARKAIERAEQAGTEAENHDEEHIAYFVEEAVKAGHGMPKPDDKGPIARWFRELWDAVKSALVKLKVDPSQLSVDDIVALARGALHQELDGGARGDSGAPLLSRATPEWVQNGAAALKTAASKIDTYAPEKTITEKVKALTENWKTRLVQGMFDAYAPLKELSPKAYVLARMTKSADGALEGMLLHGKPKMDADGAIVGDLDGKGFLGAMQELNGEHDRFFMWVAGRRAERLMGEDREHLFEKPEIEEMKKLNAGRMKDGTSRAVAYQKALTTFSEYNKSVMDIAERTGLIDGASRAMWEHGIYVPFYRVTEDDRLSGPSKIKGLVRQQAFKKLKGGSEGLGDLMANTLRNWSNLLNASLANQAAAHSLQAAERAGVALEAPEATVRQMGKSIGNKAGAVFYMDHGKERWMLVDDPFVLQAVSSIESASFKGLPMELMSKFKKYLTLGVTASPTYRIRNLMRDSLSAIGQNDMSYNVMKNLAQGYKATDRKSADYAQMLFGGAMMRFGTFVEGDRAEHAKRLIAAGVKDDTILDTRGKVKAALGKLWDGYQEFGDRMENINRAALYKQLVDEGKSHLEASFAARDSMDFSLQGSWVAMRFLSQIVPFMNARAQGLYKLGRAGKQDPKRLAYVSGAVALASIALLLANADDDEWKKREDWDRDAFWWFRIGDTAFRIPKPFEIGAIGTLAERSVELMISDEMTGKRFAERMKQMLLSTFAMNPVPQIFKPMIDIYANTDSFTGRQIETRGMERLSKSERANQTTSLIAQALGAAGDVTGLSPVQVDHLIRAYFGWLGSHVAMTVDLMAEPFQDASKPARRVSDMFVVGDFVKDLPSGQSRYVEDFYKQAKQVSEVMADIKHAREIGEIEHAKELMEENRDKIALSRVYSHAERQMGEINRKIRLTQARAGLSGDAKRERLDQLSTMRNQLARTISEKSAAARQ